ncbi:MAG: PIN domain-containing protein [Candidatus Aenigmarchaeota archaeon]|nr:PIN domain-containing protein [Candidatus Aenigmarchaeota archaeon]
MAVGYFFDTYALIEILRKNEKYGKFSETPLITSLLNIGELYYDFLKNGNKHEGMLFCGQLHGNCLNVTLEVIMKAVEFRFSNKSKNLSYIDCIGYVLAKDNGLIFVTGDNAFEGMDNVEFVK